MRQRFVALDRYDPSAICEDENYAVGLDGEPDYTQREQLYCYAVSEKLYALFNLDELGCKKPRPSCLLFDDPALWRAQDWRCLSCGAAWNLDTFPRLRTYGELVQRTLRTVDRKRLNADGSEPTAVMHGETIPRPVHVNLRTRIGKEITVDPTDTDEDFTAEMLSATNVLAYRSPEEKLQDLRGAVIAAGIKRVARISGVPRSQVQGLVNQKCSPNDATVAKIEAALARLS